MSSIDAMQSQPSQPSPQLPSPSPQLPSPSPPQPSDATGAIRSDQTLLNDLVNSRRQLKDEQDRHRVTKAHSRIHEKEALLVHSYKMRLHSTVCELKRLRSEISKLRAEREARRLHLVSSAYNPYDIESIDESLSFDDI